MLSQPPQWPDHSVQPDQPPGSSSPLSRLARARLVLAGVAIVSSVLVMALLSVLVLVLSSNARGATPGSQAQTGQIGQTATAGSAQTSTVADNGTPASGGGTSSSGGGTGGTHPTPTPTPTSGHPAPPSVHQVVHQITLSGFGEGSVVATCPAGELALSGGWAIAYNSGATIYRSTRAGTRGWAVYVNHPSSVLVTSTAECLKDAPGATITERSASVSFPPGTAGRALPKCNAGEVVVGGGFAFDLHTGVTLDVFRDNSSDTQWWGQAVNRGATSTLASVYAECLAYSGASMKATALTDSGIIAAGGRGSTFSMACPSGYYLSGGGFEGGRSGFVYDMQAQLVLGDNGSYRAWVVSLYANGGIQDGLLVEAICLHL